MSEVNGRQLFAEGAVVDLGDGVPRRVVFDLEALLRIEERCGSLTAYMEGLQRGWNGRLMRSVLAGLVGGLSHDRSIDEPRIRAALFLTIKQGLGSVQPLITALDEAWDDAIPPAAKPGAQAPGKDSAQESSSPGPSSTDEQPSTTVAATASSGG